MKMLAYYVTTVDNDENFPVYCAGPFTSSHSATAWILAQPHHTLDLLSVYRVVTTNIEVTLLEGNNDNEL